MSRGGGAGKVYFVLYLAVVLELLIIIVERDEAEEHLHRKQQETMKIVESILSQLQSGAGTEGINTRPQDEITIPPPGVNIKEVLGSDIKSFRRYVVEVGVTDVTAAIKRKEGESDKEHQERLQKLVELANVSELQYQIFYSSSLDPASAPMFQSDSYIRKNNINFMQFQPGQNFPGPGEEAWEFLGVRQLNLDTKATYDRLDVKTLRSTADIVPMYPREKQVEIGPVYAPQGVPLDSVYFYSDAESRKLGASSGENLQKRSFVVNFQPPSKAGWYKLRFFSRTNRILGVRAEQKASELDDAATVNIGTVQLTVRDLRKVLKELQMTLDKFMMPSTDEFIKTLDIDKFDQEVAQSVAMAMDDPNSVEVIGKIRLYSYIAKLLAPGMSSNFDQNRGAIEFNIRVITPKPTISEPTVNMASNMYSFDAIPHVFDFSISPYQSGNNNLVGRVLDKSGAPVARINFKPLDEIAGMNVPAPRTGDKRDIRATVDQKLAPGQYKLEVVHSLQGRSSKPEVSDLTIFETSLTDESEKKINQYLNNFGYYGGRLVLDLIPESGNKIAQNNFKTYINFDNNPQASPSDGLAITQEMNIQYKPDASKVSVRVTWVQPFSGIEVDLFTKKTYDIKQEPPSVSTRGMRVEISGQIARIKVSVYGINISKPLTGSDQQAIIKKRVGEVTKVNGLQTYSVSAGPDLEDAGDGTYTLTFELSGTLPRGESKIKGTLAVPVYAAAINPVNNKPSDEATQQITIPIDYSPDRGGQRRR